MNKVMLIGRLTKDPELSTTNGGVSICKFSIAVQRTFANSNGEKEADFFNIIVWKGLAENCHKYLKKGDKLSLVGRLQSNNYEKDGKNQYSVNVVAEEVEFLHTKNENKTENNGKKSNDVQKFTPVKDEDLPF